MTGSFKYRFIVLSAVVLTACQPAITHAHNDTAPDNTMFSKADADIKFETKTRRKWGAPVIADLDGNGFPDLLLNDHGYAIKVYWNEGGKFAKGYDLIMGDTHGIAVGDYDGDGEMNLVVTRGGGSGKNARNAKIFSVSADRVFTEAKPLSTPLKNMRGRTANFFDGDSDGNLDLLLFGFSSNKDPLDSESYIYANDGKGDLSYAGRLKKTGPNGEGLLVTDFENNGVPDLLIYGDADNLSAHQGAGDLTFSDVSAQILPAGIDHITAVEEFDFDNDGDFDLFITRSQEYLAGDTVYDADSGAFAFYTKRGPYRLPDLTIGETFILKNYQAPWPDQKIFTGEPGMNYPTPGEKHSGRDIEIVSSDALGWPDNPDEKGLYFGYVGNNKWRIAGNTHSPTTGVILNVKNAKDAPPRPGLHNILLENRNGKFVDITRQAGLYQQGHATGAAVADYDNDGFSDIFIVKRGNLATANVQTLFLNNADGTFREISNHGIVSQELGAIGSEAAALDYDLDGRVDILYSNERGNWHLYKNTIADSAQPNALTVHVGLSPHKAASPRGALVTLTGCGNTQMRRLGSSGARYSQSLNDKVHFGSGACNESRTLTVKWTNGETHADKISAKNVNVRAGMFNTQKKPVP